MWWVVLGVTQVACRSLLGFEDLQPSDAAVPDTAIDTSVDMPTGTACALTTTDAGVDRGRVGGVGGGVNFPPIACDSGSLPIGVAMRMSDGQTANGYRSAHGIEIACAPVTIESNGDVSVGTTLTIGVQGTGLVGWTPSTLTPQTTCQPGWVLSGLVAHIGADGGRFADVSIRCSQISALAIEQAVESLFVTGSLTEPVGETTASCQANEVIVAFPNRTGAGLDALNLVCAPLRCAGS